MTLSTFQKALIKKFAAPLFNLELVKELIGSTTAGEGSSLVYSAGFGTDLETALMTKGVQEVKRTVTIAQVADLAGLGAGVKTFDKNVGAVLPANARILGATLETVTDFDDATHGTYTTIVGTSAGGTQIGTSINVAAGQTGFPKAFTAGAGGFAYCPQGAAQLTARITSSVDLNTATAGTMIVNVFYLVLA